MSDTLEDLRTLIPQLGPAAELRAKALDPPVRDQILDPRVAAIRPVAVIAKKGHDRADGLEHRHSRK